MRALPTDQAADQGDQGVQMAFTMPGGARMKALHDALLYGTMPAVRVTHRVQPFDTEYHWLEYLFWLYQQLAAPLNGEVISKNASTVNKNWRTPDEILVSRPRTAKSRNSG